MKGKSIARRNFNRRNLFFDLLIQEFYRALPCQLRSLWIECLRAVFLEEPVTRPRIGVEFGRTVSSLQVIFQLPYSWFGLIRVIFCEVAKESCF